MITPPAARGLNVFVVTRCSAVFPFLLAMILGLLLIIVFPGIATFLIDPETGTEAIIENMDMLSDEYRRVQLLALWNNAPNLLLTADTPIRSLDDLSGLSIRVPSRNESSSSDS